MSAASAFTPGPWHVGPLWEENDPASQKWLVVWGGESPGPGIKWDCVCALSRDESVNERDIANGRLIAAAPDLYAALRTAALVLQDIGHRQDDAGTCARAVLAEVQTALAKVQS